MPVTIEDLIQAGLEAADCEKSNNFSADELRRYANESLSEVYDEIVIAWESYFQQSADFAIDDSGKASLRQITTGIQAPDAFPVASLPIGNPRVVLMPIAGVFGSTVSALLTPQFFDVNGTASHTTPRLSFIPPAGRIIQIGVTPNSTVGAPSDVTIYKNGQPTVATGFMSSGASGSQNFLENTWPEPVHFNGEDALDFVIQERSSAASWAFSGILFIWLDQPDSLFYKEAGLIKSDCSDPIMPLDTYSQRNNVQGPRYWIAGDTLSIWPQFPGSATHAGNYTLDYVPNCPILESGDTVPPELARWRELISVTIAIKCKTKRDQDISSLTARQLKLIEGITVAKGKRKKEVRRMQPMHNWDQFPRGWYWNGRGRYGGW